jgi:hypothetical protein
LVVSRRAMDEQKCHPQRQDPRLIASFPPHRRCSALLCGTVLAQAAPPLDGVASRQTSESSSSSVLEVMMPFGPLLRPPPARGVLRGVESFCFPTGPGQCLWTGQISSSACFASCRRDWCVFCLSVHLSVCLSVCLSVRPSVCLSVCPSVRPSVCSLTVSRFVRGRVRRAPMRGVVFRV